MKIMSVVGARPNFMKIAPIVKAFSKYKKVKHVLVHTGQHYDAKMSKSFFDELNIPRPNIDLGVGSDSHARQTARIMVKFEEVLKKQKPAVVVVVGDVNSTLACSVTATKMGFPVVHVEAGLRSFDRNMPEELNRLVTDSLSSLLFTTCPEGNVNLKNEGVPSKKIIYVGNVMIDTLIQHREKAKSSKILNKLKLEQQGFALATLHRPSNVDSKESLSRIVNLIEKVQKKLPLVIPIHPRTYSRFKQFGFLGRLKRMHNLHLIEPLGYLDFLKMMMECKCVLTDSGGIQEETTYLNIPCITLRENTERPVTVLKGTNYLTGMNQSLVLKTFQRILKNKGKRKKTIRYWDGRSAERIAEALVKKRWI